jgi:hypothetical protein
MVTSAAPTRRRKAQRAAVGLIGLALAAAGSVPARAQAQIGGALPGLPPQVTLPTPLPHTLTGPITATPLPPSAPTPQTAAPPPAAAAAPVAVPAQPAR